jgi:hypothetical protein
MLASSKLEAPPIGGASVVFLVEMGEGRSRP